jgi:N-acetylglucosaminyl-diphospho-decaprenol L-rhamnosyltransferase
VPDSRLTVVIVSKDRRAELLRNLPRHLELPERPHVILVDDASTDGSADAVEAAFPAVEVIRLDESRGGAARNVGTARARTPYVAYCDDDSWFDPGALGRAADLLDAHPRLALVNGRVLVGPEEREDPLNEELAASPLPREDGQPGHPLLSFIACAVVVRRDAVLAAGGFPDRFGVGGEEEILGWDLAAAGWLMSYVPEIVAHHHPPKHSGRPERRVRGLRNTLWTTWLRRPLRAAVVRTARQLRRLDWDRHTVRGVAEAVAGLPWVVRERRVSPPHVEERRLMLEEQQLGSRARRYV